MAPLRSRHTMILIDAGSVLPVKMLQSIRRGTNERPHSVYHARLLRNVPFGLHLVEIEVGLTGQRALVSSMANGL
jgi:hypothetical protein